MTTEAKRIAADETVGGGGGVKRHKTFHLAGGARVPQARTYASRGKVVARSKDKIQYGDVSFCMGWGVFCVVGGGDCCVGVGVVNALLLLSLWLIAPSLVVVVVGAAALSSYFIILVAVGDVMLLWHALVVPSDRTSFHVFAAMFLAFSDKRRSHVTLAVVSAIDCGAAP